MKKLSHSRYCHAEFYNQFFKNELVTCNIQSRESCRVGSWWIFWSCLQWKDASLRNTGISGVRRLCGDLRKEKQYKIDVILRNGFSSFSVNIQIINLISFCRFAAEACREGYLIGTYRGRSGKSHQNKKDHFEISDLKVWRCMKN